MKTAASEEAAVEYCGELVQGNDFLSRAPRSRRGSLPDRASAEGEEVSHGMGSGAAMVFRHWLSPPGAASFALFAAIITVARKHGVIHAGTGWCRLNEAVSRTAPHLLLGRRAWLGYLSLLVHI